MKRMTAFWESWQYTHVTLNSLGPGENSEEVFKASTGWLVRENLSKAATRA